MPELHLKHEDILAGQNETFTSGSDSPKHFMKTQSSGMTDCQTYQHIYLG